MSYQVLPDSANADRQIRTRKRYLPSLLVLAMTALSSPGYAQIVQQNGASQQDSRASPTTPSPGTPETVVHESMKPQAKHEAKRSAHPQSSKATPTRSSNTHNADGGGGFQNGLYGTGAGSNK